MALPEFGQCHKSFYPAFLNPLFTFLQILDIFRYDISKKVAINSMMHLALHYTTDISLPFFKYRRRKNVPAFEKAGTSRSADIEI